MRKNFYELLSEMKLDIYSEYTTLMYLLREEECYAYHTAEYYIDNNIFRQLTFRGTSTSLSNMFNKLGLGMFSDKLDDLLLLCEILIAIYSESKLNSYGSIPRDFKEQMNTIKGNIDAILQKANYEVNVMPNNKNRKIIVSKNPATVLAAEVVGDISVATNLFEYNYYAIKGHLEEKRIILNAIASYLEPSLKVKELKDTSYKTLESELSFLLNKFHVRHNNKDGANTQEYIVGLSDSQLEEWYDKIYTTSIMYILARENISIHKELDELKKNYTWSN